MDLIRISRSIALSLLLISLILCIHVSVAEQLNWAREGAWFKYRTEFESSGIFFGGEYHFKVVNIIKYTVINSTNDYFAVRAEIEDYTIEATPEELKKMLEEQIKEKIPDRIIYWNSTERGSTYYNPEELPTSGIIEWTHNNITVRAEYDTKTGLLKKLEATGSTIASQMSIKIELIDSNIELATRNPLSALLEPPLIYIIIGSAATVVAIAISLVIIRHRRTS